MTTHILHRRTTAALSLAVALAISMPPATAFAAEGDALDEGVSASESSAQTGAVERPSAASSDSNGADRANAEAATYDRANWIDFDAERAARENRVAQSGDEVNLLVSYNIVSLSDEFKDHLKYESGQNYDQGFSYGDGYHALGYYQFDNRYVLQDFLVYCYGYDADKFSMFAFAADPSLNIASESMYDYATGSLTEIGQKLEDAWHAAYAAEPKLFAALQDTYAYESYYLPVEQDLAAQGIDISDRADCVKGLCWGMSSLFGPSGCHYFLGGYVYEWNDATGSYEYVYYEGAGLTDDMSDAEFVVAAAGYVVDHVAEIYASQPQYHEGWQNRYRNEIADCLGYLPDVVAGAWYGEYVSYVQANSIMSGHSSGYQVGRFGPEDRITRAQVVTILYRCANPNSTATTDPNAFTVSTTFRDMPTTPTYYAAAVDWCYAVGITTGHKDGVGNPTGYFGPDDPITREQLATMLYRFAAYMGCNVMVSNSAAFDMMPDRAEVPEYAVDAFAWCIDRGIITGSSEAGQLWINPDDVARRAQMAKMVTVLMRDVM